MNEICLSCRKHTKCGRAKHETIGCGYYVPMTNEEFLRSCTREELAEALFHIMASNEFTMYLIHTEKKSVQDIKNAIMEWLQEVHHG